VAARVIPTIAAYRPGRAAKKIAFPILFCVSDTDSVTPPAQTLRYARTAPRGEIKRYDAGHFEFYTGATFEALICRWICQEGRWCRRPGRVFSGAAGGHGVGRCLVARVSVLDAWSMLICAGWLPHDGLFGGSGCAGLEIERGGGAAAHSAVAGRSSRCRDQVAGRPVCGPC
jgi:hypothetical protein